MLLVDDVLEVGVVLAKLSGPPRVLPISMLRWRFVL
jgi:hypothetical protein